MIVPLIVFLAAISYSIWLVIALVLPPSSPLTFASGAACASSSPPSSCLHFHSTLPAALRWQSSIPLEVRRYSTVQMFSPLSSHSFSACGFILEFVVQMCERLMERCFDWRTQRNEP